MRSTDQRFLETPDRAKRFGGRGVDHADLPEIAVNASEQSRNIDLSQ